MLRGGEKERVGKGGGRGGGVVEKQVFRGPIVCIAYYRFPMTVT